MAIKNDTSLTHTDGTGPSFVEVSEGGNGVRVALPSYKEMQAPDYLEMSKRMAVVEAKGYDARGAKVWPGKDPRRKKTKLAVMGINGDILKKGDKDYANSVRMAVAYRKKRTRELYLVFGYVSSGVSALLANASLAMAGSRFLYERIAVTGDYGLISQATKAADSARQNELAAWELCSRESIANKKAQAQEEGLPWLKVQDQGESKRGPKPKQEKAAMGDTIVVESNDAR